MIILFLATDEGFFQLVPVFMKEMARSLLLKTDLQTLLEDLASSGVLQGIGVESLNAVCFATMFHFRSEFDLHDRNNEAIICPALICPSDSSGKEHILLVSGSYDDSINEVPVLRSRMLPKDLKPILLVKQGVGYH